MELNIRNIICGILILLLQTVSVYAKKSYTFTSGNWAGQAHFYDNGSFKSCTISTTYQSGTEFFVVVNKSLGWAIGLNNTEWDLPAGEKQEVLVQVDDKPIVKGSSQNLSTQGYYIIFDKESKLLDLLMTGREMRIAVGTSKARYELKGTLNAIRSLKKCAVLRRKIVKPRKVAKKKPVTKVNPQFKSNINPVEKDIQDKPAIDTKKLKRQIAIEYVTRLLESRGISGYKILAKSDHPQKGYDVMWRTAGRHIGGVSFIKDNNGLNIDKLSGQVIGQDAADCDGEFASAKKLSDNEKSKVIRKISTVCRKTNDTQEVQYFIFKRKDGVFIKVAQTHVLSVGSQLGPNAPTGPSFWNNPDQSIIDILPKQ